eukprot:scaffold22139_cov146-Isochrysis_galbana.AAC.5
MDGWGPGLEGRHGMGDGYGDLGGRRPLLMRRARMHSRLYLNRISAQHSSTASAQDKEAQKQERPGRWLAREGEGGHRRGCFEGAARPLFGAGAGDFALKWQNVQKQPRLVRAGALRRTVARPALGLAAGRNQHVGRLGVDRLGANPLLSRAGLRGGVSVAGPLSERAGHAGRSAQGCRPAERHHGRQLHRHRVVVELVVLLRLVGSLDSLPLRLPPHRVPTVLDGVVGPAGEELDDLRPARAQLAHPGNDGRVLRCGPISFGHVGRQVVVPALAALLPAPAVHVGADGRPTDLAARGRGRCDQLLQVLVLRGLPNVLLPGGWRRAL